MAPSAVAGEPRPAAAEAATSARRLPSAPCAPAGAGGVLASASFIRDRLWSSDALGGLSSSGIYGFGAMKTGADACAFCDCHGEGRSGSMPACSKSAMSCA